MRSGMVLPREGTPAAVRQVQKPVLGSRAGTGWPCNSIGKAAASQINGAGLKSGTIGLDERTPPDGKPSIPHKTAGYRQWQRGAMGRLRAWTL